MSYYTKWILIIITKIEHPLFIKPNLADIPKGITVPNPSTAISKKALELVLEILEDLTDYKNTEKSASKLEKPIQKKLTEVQEVANSYRSGIEKMALERKLKSAEAQKEKAEEEKRSHLTNPKEPKNTNLKMDVKSKICALESRDSMFKTKPKKEKNKICTPSGIIDTEATRNPKEETKSNKKKKRKLKSLEAVNMMKEKTQEKSQKAIHKDEYCYQNGIGIKRDEQEKIYPKLQKSDIKLNSARNIKDINDIKNLKNVNDIEYIEYI
ncbi:hypothetical protein C2G38_2153065 [Gigaspora rosea]|uniref:Uncharacterized protein n=1 Tax=Gigaspora rosea TaxID=44941 RepID=A0A397W6H4_9GLOM|nr:hypothetical protein C2G38_2153065 [Gigaspora rosea]